MIETLPAILPLLIPILGILLGFVVVAGIFIVKPLTDAMSRLAAGQQGPGAEGTERRLQALEDRLASLEGSVGRLSAEHDFDRKLERGAERSSPGGIAP